MIVSKKFEDELKELKIELIVASDSCSIDVHFTKDCLMKDLRELRYTFNLPPVFALLEKMDSLKNMEFIEYCINYIKPVNNSPMFNDVTWQNKHRFEFMNFIVPLIERIYRCE